MSYQEYIMWKILLDKEQEQYNLEQQDVRSKVAAGTV